MQKSKKQKPISLIAAAAILLLILASGTSCAGQNPGSRTTSAPIEVAKTPSVEHTYTPAVDPTAAISRQTEEPLISPVLSPQVYGPAGERSRETMAEDSEMDLLILPMEDRLFPAVYGSAYRRTETSREEMDGLALQTAVRLWGPADPVNGIYEGPAADTEYGRFIERVGAFMESVIYMALWEDLETDPFFYGDHVVLTEAEAVDLVLEFLTKAGWDTYADGEPLITETFSAGGDPKTAGAQTLTVYWPEKIPDTEMRTASVRAEILNGQISHVSLSFSQYESVDKEDPDYLLSAEEALYCLNYARSLVHDRDHPLMTYPYLQSVWPSIQYDYSTDSGVYVPTWVFFMSSDRGGKSGMRTEIYVVAATGVVETGTNAGNLPSPYRE